MEQVELRERVRELIRKRLSERHDAAVPPPRYDDVFFRGVEQLDQPEEDPWD